MTGPDLTPLDRAHVAMETGGDATRLAFYRLLADTELTVWLQKEAAEGSALPQISSFEEGEFILGFDREERLAEITGAPVPTLALPGRALARMLAGQGIGLALNLGDAPSAMLIPPAAIDWLVETLDGAATASQTGAEDARIAAVGPAQDVPAELASALGAALAAISKVTGAFLVTARYADGSEGPLLVVTEPEATDPVANAVSEAVVFSGVEDFALDVAVMDTDAPVMAQVRDVGMALQIERAAPEDAQVLTPSAPGMDPNRPPRLR